MRVLIARNVHQALPMGLDLLDKYSQHRESRNGPVLIYPEAVTTTYLQPTERCVFWPARDFNIAFCLYEALWMLAGRNDVAPLTRYVKDFGQFSDDGKTLHGAYGYRWRKHFGFDQLDRIVQQLTVNPADRRCVLQMWDPEHDLGTPCQDVPCNDTITFQRGAKGELNMEVFCRSNDILWGAYFANAFHFSFLLEYMAYRIGCPVGVYEQISVNWHGYLKTLESVKDLPRNPSLYANPYAMGNVIVSPLEGDLDKQIHLLLEEADSDTFENLHTTTWARAARSILQAHSIYRNNDGPIRFETALALLDRVKTNNDWVVAMREWLTRRFDKWKATNGQSQV